MKYSTLLLTLLACNTFAATPELQGKELEKAKEILQELGLPLPDSGIHIVPRSMLNLTKETLAKGKKDEEEMKQQGFVLTKYSDAPLMFSFKKQATKDTANKSELMAESTGIREDIEDIPLAFEAKNINKNMQGKSVTPFTILGAVPYGAYHESGWSGVSQFFKTQDFSVCSYAVLDVKTSHTAAKIAMEDVSYQVNNKATLYVASGNPQQGYTYNVKWFDEEQFHDLTCATHKHNNENKEKVLALANQLESN